jgi:transposase, IS30 family
MAHKHLNHQERFYIEQRLAEGDTIPQIAKTLGRHKTSLYRELKRNTDPSIGFYSYLRAKNIATERKHHTVRRVKLLNTIDQNTNQLIHKMLKLRMSPDQISGLFRTQFQVQISKQTLYRYIWENRSHGGDFYQHLRRRGKKRKNKLSAIIHIQNKVNIAVRKNIAFLRQEAGHYEIDTIFGLDQKSFLLTLVDIATKYTIIVKLYNKEAITIYHAIKNIMANTLLPFKSITSDNGSEFAKHDEIAQETNIKWYFCDPYSSWQRGLNENTNGLIRDIYPKRTDFRWITDDELLKWQNNLNNRPRKTLNYATPTDEMVKYLTLPVVNT